MTPRITSAGRVAALAGTALVLLATSYSGPMPGATGFDAATACGPAGVVILRVERREAGCGGSYDSYGLVHAEGGPAVGLPALGELDPGFLASGFGPAGQILGGTVVLSGDVPLPGAVPPSTVRRRCETHGRSDTVLLVTCEGPDPEAACTGTLTLRQVTP